MLYADPDIYIITEFAKILGVLPKTLRRWDRQGVMHPHAHDGAGRWYHKDQLGPAREILSIRRAGGKLPDELTSREIASLANVHIETLYNYVERGQIIPKRRLGKAMFWLPSQVDTIKQCWHQREEHAP